MPLRARTRLDLGHYTVLAEFERELWAVLLLRSPVLWSFPDDVARRRRAKKLIQRASSSRESGCQAASAVRLLGIHTFRISCKPEATDLTSDPEYDNDRHDTLLSQWYDCPSSSSLICAGHETSHDLATVVRTSGARERLGWGIEGSDIGQRLTFGSCVGQGRVLAAAGRWP